MSGGAGAIRVGVLGGGQLGRMLGLAGVPLGIQFRFLDASEAPPAGAVGDVIHGSFDDEAALDRFCAGLTVATYEFENVPLTTARRVAARVPLIPSERPLGVAQDRWTEKCFLRELGVTLPEFALIARAEDVPAAIARTGLPAILKTRRLGYDGKGQARVDTIDDAQRAWASLGGAEATAEQFIRFDRELSIIAVRGRSAESRFYPLVHNRHEGGILRVSRAPAPDHSPALQSAAESIACRVMDALDYIGVLAIELFEAGGRLLVNELAPRVHNSGHWTIEGAECSQFENHLRALLDWPLGSTTARGHCQMINLIGEVPPAEALLAIPGARLHLYGKAPRSGRKLGHVTVLAENADQLAARGELVRANVRLS